MAWDGMGAFVRALERARGAGARPAPGRPAPRGRGDRRPRHEGRRPGAPLRERRRARRFPLLINAYGSRRADVARARRRRPRGARARHRRARARARRPSSARELAAARARSSPSSRTSRRAPSATGAVPGRGAHGRRRRSRRPPDPHVLARGRRPVHHAAAGHHARPGDGRAQRRLLPHAEARPRAARPCTGRCTRPARATSAAPGSWGCAGSKSPSRSAAIRRSPTPRPRRCPTGSTSGCSRASCASARSTTRQVQDGGSRGPGRRRLRPRGLRRSAGGPRRRGAVRRSHGYYTPVDRFPRFHVTAITHREGAVYPATLVGPPPMEDAWLGKATERLFLPMLRLLFPEVVDMNLPVEGAFHNLVLVSIKKQYPYPRRAPGPRPLGRRADVVLEGHLRRRRGRRRAGPRAGRVAAARQPRSEARLRVRRRADRPARPRREPGALGQQGVHRRDAEVAGRGVRARVARAVPHERRGRGARRRDVGRARDRRAPAPRPRTVRTARGERPSQRERARPWRASSTSARELLARARS